MRRALRHRSLATRKRCGAVRARRSDDPSPDRLAERLDRVANAAPSEAAEELRMLVEETKVIVKREMSDVDVDVAWQVTSK
jgi:hypothetical protein